MQMLGQLGYAFQLNLCTDMIEVNGSPITDIVAARIRTDCRDAGIRPLAGVEDAYTAAAEGNAYHPIQDYLRGLSWDGTYRIAQLASKMTCIDPPVVAPDGTQHSLLHIYLWRWMIGVIARTLDQRQNLMLVLVGPQRCGKSTLAEWLCPLPDYFIRKGIDVCDKDTLIRMIGKWIWEVAELDATTRKADQSALKDLITMSSITVRRAYGRYDIQRPALASFIGTLNPSIGFLTDDTGNRRFMVTQIAAIDWSYQQIDRDQLWAEAVAAYQAGESWQPLPHEAAAQAEANKLHETGSLWDGWIVRYFDTDAGPADRMTASDIVDHLRQYHDIRSGGSPRAQEMEIARVLARLGVVKHRTPTWRGYVGIRPK
jgi:putative DNA primase/helicase